MSRRVIGLDLGAYSVKLVRLESGKETPRFEVINAVEEILACGDDDNKELIDKQREAIAKFASLGLLEGEVFASGLEAHASQLRSMQVPYLDNRKLEAVLPGMLEAEMPFSINDMIVSWCRDPVLTQGPEKPEFANIKVAFGKKTAIAEILQLLQTFSVNPRLLHLSSAALFELVRELPLNTILDASSIDSDAVHAFIDFGHRATNLCIFDRTGLKYARSFLRGGKKLTEEIGSKLGIAFSEAERLKHDTVDLSKIFCDGDAQIVNKLAEEHHRELVEDISRTIISLRTSGLCDVKTATLLGGGALTGGISEFFGKHFNGFGIAVVGLSNQPQWSALTPSLALAFAYSISCLKIHAKESRFNFRKDEFTWRGDLDFVRTKSTALILWGLILICSLTLMWSASSLVLEKESKHIENQLKAECLSILGQKNIAPKKCLAQMKEQIASNVDMGIPEFSASDIYVEAAKYLPSDLNVTINEMDISEKKVRLIARASSFEDVDKVVANLAKIPCFVNVEKGRAKQLDGTVEFQLSGDVDCEKARTKEERQPTR